MIFFDFFLRRISKIGLIICKTRRESKNRSSPVSRMWYPVFVRLPFCQSKDFVFLNGAPGFPNEVTQKPGPLFRKPENGYSVLGKKGTPLGKLGSTLEKQGTHFFNKSNFRWLFMQSVNEIYYLFSDNNGKLIY